MKNQKTISPVMAIIILTISTFFLMAITIILFNLFPQQQEKENWQCLEWKNVNVGFRPCELFSEGQIAKKCYLVTKTPIVFRTHSEFYITTYSTIERWVLATNSTGYELDLPEIPCPHQCLEPLENRNIIQQICIREGLNCHEETVPCKSGNNIQYNICAINCVHEVLTDSELNFTQCSNECQKSYPICFMKSDGTFEYGLEEDKIKNTKTVCEQEREVT